MVYKSYLCLIIIFLINVSLLLLFDSLTEIKSLNPQDIDLQEDISEYRSGTYDSSMIPKVISSNTKMENCLFDCDNSISVNDIAFLLTYKVQKGDTLLRILKKFNIPNGYSIIHHIQNSQIEDWTASKIYPGMIFSFLEYSDKSKSFEIKLSPNRTIKIEYSPNIIIEDVREVTNTKEMILTSKLKKNFWTTAKSLGLTSKQIYNLISILQNDIDLDKEVHGNEQLTILANVVESEDNNISIESIWAILFETENRIIKRYHIQLDDAWVWVDEEGSSQEQSMLLSPLDYSYISSTYGAKRKKGYHGGIDFAARIGTPVRSVSDGKVKLAKWNGGYGKQVQIQHDQFGDYVTTYAHLSKTLVKKGQYIKKGTIIGKVGTTGNSTGPHLHYELKIDGKRVHPHKHNIPIKKDFTQLQRLKIKEQKCQYDNKILYLSLEEDISLQDCQKMVAVKGQSKTQ